jgi:hypothetical protein
MAYISCHGTVQCNSVVTKGNSTLYIIYIYCTCSAPTDQVMTTVHASPGPRDHIYLCYNLQDKDSGTVIRSVISVKWQIVASIYRWVIFDLSKLLSAI